MTLILIQLKEMELKTKKTLWNEFIPKDGRKYGDIIYASDPYDVELPSTMRD